MFPWKYVDGVSATKSEGFGLIVGTIIYPYFFQSMWSWCTNVSLQTDGQTDGQRAIARPRFAL